jgi:glycosyltransferase involved in cell wall biosynthesis
MRIAVLSTLASGGAAGAAWRLTRALSDFGHECSFFILEGSGNPRHVSLLDGDDPCWLPALFGHWYSLTTPESLIAHATELFSDSLTGLNVPFPLPAAFREAEVIHLHWVAGMLFSPVLLQAVAGKKVVWTLHDENALTGGCHYAGDCRNFQSQCRDCPQLKAPGPDDASARCFAFKEQLYPFLNPSLVAPSAWLAERAKASALLGSFPVTVIPYSLDTASFRPPHDRPLLREKLGLPEDAFVIMAGCEYLDNQRKNVKTFFEALALLSGESPALPLAVMSYGHGQPPELAFPARHFGYVDNEADMAELYGAADLFVHTSLQDNLPLTLCEAQACGVPTLCFAVGGCPETMLPEETGFLVAEASSQALAEKLRSIIAARDSLAGMREAVRAFAEKRFDPRTVAAAYTEIFEKARTAPGLNAHDPLFAGLLQNQLASLAQLTRQVVHETNRRLDETKQYLEELRGIVSKLHPGT